MSCEASNGADYGWDVLCAADTTSLALHSWRPTRPRALLFYIHGIQSHAGWLFQTGSELARRGVAVFALDRRGSGRSGGLRGDVPSLDLLLDDYSRALEAARAQYRDVSVTLLGQSLGGSVLAGLVTAGHAMADRLVFCAPALAQMRAKLSPDQLRSLEGETRTDLIPVELRDEDYTDLVHYQRFMAGDELMLRRIPRRSRATFLALESYYLAAQDSWPDVPVALALPRSDPIIRLDAAKKALETLAVRSPDLVEFDVTVHYLEFSSARETYWDWLGSYVTHPSVETAS